MGILKRQNCVRIPMGILKDNCVRIPMSVLKSNLCEDTLGHFERKTG